MTGVVEIEITGLDAAIGVLNRLGSESLRVQALEQLGGLIENQSKNRFSERKAPDGAPWAEWSRLYAKTRGIGHSLLVGDGHLRDSIAWLIDGADLHVGSNLVYAAIHQMGGEEGMRPGPAAIPARPYMGLSDANVTEAEEALAHWLGGVLQ